MTISNKILTKPSGRPIGQQMGGGSEYYALQGSLAFFRDDFNGSAIDANEWDTTSAPITGTGSIFMSAGSLCIDLGVSSSAVATVTSKDKYRIPFRLIAAVGIEGYNTGIEGLIRVRDTSNTFIAEWLTIGSAGGTEHSASVRVRAGSTAAGMIASAAVDPSAVVAIAGSAGLMYVIDADYGGITFGMVTGGASTAAFTSIPQVPKVNVHVVSPVLKANVPYVVEFIARSGTAVEAAGAAYTAATETAAMKIAFCEVRQYVPDSVFQQKSNVMQVYSSTTGTGATAMIGLTQLKWG